ncbi:MAG: hypothetical protein C5B54_04355, partial [Acidobacteria bacterium]
MNLALFSRAVYPLHGYGGLERHCYGWIRAMLKLNCKIDVITMPPLHSNRLSEFPRKVSFHFLPGVSARSVFQRITSYPRWVKSAGVLLRKLESTQNLDAVYAHGLAAAGCNNLETPVYYNPHGMEEFKGSGLKSIAYSGFRNSSRHAARIATKVIATDAAMIREVGHFLNVTDSKIALLPNAIDLDPGDVEQFQVDGDPIFLSVGRLEANKGFSILLHALSKATIPKDWKLYLVGQGSQLAPLKQLATALNLSSRVLFTEELSDARLNFLYSRAQLFIHPTLYEGSSIVALEAMKNSLPIVATKTGGLPDKVFPEKNGWLVQPNDVDELAQAITSAYQNKNQWEHMGQNSRRIVEEHFSWNCIGPK